MRQAGRALAAQRWNQTLDRHVQSPALWSVSHSTIGYSAQQPLALPALLSSGTPLITVSTRRHAYSTFVQLAFSIGDSLTLLKLDARTLYLSPSHGVRITTFPVSWSSTVAPSWIASMQDEHTMSCPSHSGVCGAACSHINDGKSASGFWLT